MAAATLALCSLAAAGLAVGSAGRSTKPLQRSQPNTFERGIRPEKRVGRLVTTIVIVDRGPARADDGFTASRGFQRHAFAQRCNPCRKSAKARRFDCGDALGSSSCL